MSRDRWDSWPARQSQEFLLGMEGWHEAVASVNQISPNCYEVTRNDGTVVKVFMTPAYEFTLSDYSELRQKHPDVDCIVQASTWNHFTDAARGEARGDEVGTFHLKGLVGALNFNDEAFLDYPDDQY